MTTMIERFYGMPQSIIRSGKLKVLSGCATKLLVALWHDSERYSTRELVRKVAELQELIGGSRNSHAKARRQLVAEGLVEAEPYGLDGFVFNLCDPDTKKPWPGNPRGKPSFNTKQSAGKEKTDSSCLVNPLRKLTKSEQAGVNFPFGANEITDVHREGFAVGSNNSTGLYPLIWDELGGR